MSIATRFRQIPLERRDELVAKGHRPSDVFPHRYYVLPKCGPDGFKLAQRMCGGSDPDACWEIVLYAESPVVDEFPDELYFDDDVVWHQQQLGRKGQVANVNLVVDGPRLYSMIYQSDLVQRIGRRREWKTRVENRFRGWVAMLLNAAMSFAAQSGLEALLVPTAELALRHTDPRRNPERELFERIYDRTVARLFRTTRRGEWWQVAVEENRDRFVLPEAKVEEQPDEKTICIVHDVERGFGHRDVAPDFAALADRTSGGNLDRMLAAEEAAGIRATYSVVGTIFAEERRRIEPHHHALAFHSYDHVVREDASTDQLGRCRAVDYRVKGYRAPASRLTPETREENLLFHNFEWFASSRYSLGFGEPVLRKRIVTIPIAFDDFELYKGEVSYAEWERCTLDEIARRSFTAFGLHDCYAAHWLPHYGALLEKILEMAMPRTLDEIAARVVLRNAC